MQYGFVKTALCSPQIKVADVEFNLNSTIKAIEDAYKKGAELIVFPELNLSASTLFNLFESEVLLDGVINSIDKLLEYSKGISALIIVGAPIKHQDRIYNTAVAICDGKILGVVPQKFIVEGYNFSKCLDKNSQITLLGQTIPFGSKIIFKSKENAKFTVSAELGSDLLSPLSPSTSHALNGANIIVNLSAFCESVGSEELRLSSVKAQAEKLCSAYVMCNASYGESTTDCVYGGQKIIAEKSKVLAESKIFDKDMIISDIDVDFISNERAKAFRNINHDEDYVVVEFCAESNSQKLDRKFKALPFVPSDDKSLDNRAELILNMQAEGLKKRLEHTHSSTAVIGLSGGLDSTLAILVAERAMRSLNRSLKDIIAITMPCFGTTSRTYQNTIKLAQALGVTLKKIDITKSVQRHLKDIKHAEDNYDTTFENAQARERTQVLMDVANMNNGLVIGTGDLSELALGWATYNGDHMSMYAVNCSIPKTLVRHIVNTYAKSSKGKLKAVLLDILDTPVSPELLPADGNDIAQKTEDIVGPYILHDFFLYNMLRRGYSPKKLLFVATETFKGNFDKETILKWLKTFIRRFFMQQFKRSCLPDGVKVGSVSLSPRGEFKMPSDAVCTLWLNELDQL